MRKFWIVNRMHIISFLPYPFREDFSYLNEVVNRFGHSLDRPDQIGHFMPGLALLMDDYQARDLKKSGKED